MHTGSIPLSDVPGGLDLSATLESGLTFLWRRADGQRYGDASSHDGCWYYTVADGDVVFARQREGRLDWRATSDASDTLRHRLRLGDDLDAIFDAFPDDDPLERAQAAFPGLRVVRDPFFPCLVSFICSARTGVARIHDLATALAEEFGAPAAIDGDDPVPPGGDASGVERPYRAFPAPDSLAAAREGRLQDLGLGFRAPRVREAAAMVADGEVTAADLRDRSYERARERLQTLPGVGPKVADCVALFALGHLEAVPVDRWTRRLVAAYYPDCDRGSDAATAAAFRERFGAFAGYAQTYLYHYVRSGASDAV